MAESSVLVLGTRNRKKGGELHDLLAPHGVDVRTLAEFPQALEVEETGTTFAENAALKASLQSRHLQRWVLGEDSGLEVDALNGAPGVFSARFSGADADDQSNNRKLLQELGDTPLQKRTARYVCHATLADPGGIIRLECEQYCCGRIRLQPAGDAGFGYDPLFEIREYHQTFGQLGDAAKQLLSHRARALCAMIPELLKLLRCDS